MRWDITFKVATHLKVVVRLNIEHLVIEQLKQMATLSGAKQISLNKTFEIETFWSAYLEHSIQPEFL